MKINYPKVYLAIDNCFASKRWTEPAEWMRIVRKSGLDYVEASADNECDPLYMDPGYLEDWISEVARAEKEKGVCVANIYSGHGSYATLGLAHDDRRNRDRIQKQWLEPMIRMAGRINAGVGFFCHAFNQRTLLHPERYHTALEDLYSRLSEIAVSACRNGLPRIGVEQMYTPHQVPWTIRGAEEMLRQVYSRSGKNFYITIDTGHQSGQRRFLRPDKREIEKALRTLRKSGTCRNLWLGSERAYMLFKSIAEGTGSSGHGVEDIVEEMNKYPYLFAEEGDGDTYEWIEQLGCFSPIIHLQQTDGRSSSHLPFDRESNRSGIIKGEKILRSLARSCRRKHTGMPPVCDEIYLTLEIFAGTVDFPSEIMNKIESSVTYWRKFIPEDGISLGKLL